MGALQVGGSILEFLLGGANVLQTNKLNEEAFAANQARYDEVQQGYTDMMASTGQVYEDATAEMLEIGGNISDTTQKQFTDFQTQIDLQNTTATDRINTLYGDAAAGIQSQGDASLQQLNTLGQGVQTGNQANWNQLGATMGGLAATGQADTSQGFSNLQANNLANFYNLQGDAAAGFGGAMTDTANRYGGLQDQVAGGYGSAMGQTQSRYDTLAETTLDRYGGAQTGAINAYGQAQDVAMDRYGGAQDLAMDRYGGYAKTMDARQKGRYDTAMGMLEGAGDQRRKDIEEAWQGQASRGGQDMVSRGLTGTTIMPTMQAGYERQKQAEMGRLDESLRQQKVGLHTGLTGEAAAANMKITGAGLGAASNLQQAGLGTASNLQATGLGTGMNFQQAGLGAATGIGQTGAGAVTGLQATATGAATNIGQAGVSDLNQLQQAAVATDINLGQQAAVSDTAIGQAGINADTNWSQTNLNNQLGIGSAYATSDLGLGVQGLDMNQNWMGNQLGMANTWQQGQVGSQLGQMGNYNQMTNVLTGAANDANINQQQNLATNLQGMRLGGMNAQNQLQSTALAYTDAVQNPYHDSSQGWNMMAQGLSNLTYQPPKAETDNTGDYILGGAMVTAAAVSDRRLKEHFGTIEDPLAKINAITGKTYHFKSVQDDNHRDAGVIAQDVEAVLPEAVIEREGVKYVKYEAVIALLVEATKALTRRIEQLEEAK